MENPAFADKFPGKPLVFIIYVSLLEGTVVYIVLLETSLELDTHFPGKPGSRRHDPPTWATKCLAFKTHRATTSSTEIQKATLIHHDYIGMYVMTIYWHTELLHWAIRFCIFNNTNHVPSLNVGLVPSSLAKDSWTVQCPEGTSILMGNGYSLCIDDHVWNILKLPKKTLATKAVFHMWHDSQWHRRNHLTQHRQEDTMHMGLSKTW